MSSIDTFIDRLNSIPPKADHILREIRKLDKDVEVIHLQLHDARDQLLRAVQNSPMSNSARQQFQRQYNAISRM